MPKRNEECLELKNIEYQNMLLNNKKENKKKEELDNIEKILSTKQISLKKKPWNKLSKADKLNKIIIYSDEYVINNKLNEIQSKSLKRYLINLLERKQLQRTKDVQYCSSTNKIKNIPGLIYNKNLKKYTLKRVDKKTSTLKSLAPKKKKNKLNKNIKDKK